jgi:hypothetical protein
MGAGPSLDGEIKEAKEIMEKFIVTFAKNYSMMYAVGMAKAALHEQDKAARGPKWELLKCTDDPEAPIRKQGVMLKRSKHLKKWNSRFFVVRGNWIVDFWENEDQFKQDKKPRGTMNLSGMSIIRDPNDTYIKRVLDLAKKCNLNVDDIPKPEQLPDFSLEVTHTTRDCVLLQCENAEEHKAWCDILDDCRWYSRNLNIQDDKIHLQVFHSALWRTRWQCGIWGWWYGGGGEEQYLTDCINDAIVDAVMPSVDSKLTMPWVVRSKIRNTFTKNVNTAVIGAVKPAWAGAYEGVKKVRDALKDTIAGAVAPIGEAQRALQDKIMEMADKPSKEAIGDKVAPHLDPLLQIIFAPVNEAFKLVLQAFDTALENGKSHYKPREDRCYLVRNHSWNGHFWDADRKMWDLFDPLWDMRKVFSDVSPWGITGKARRRLRKIMKNALFTFETRLEEQGGAEHWDRVAAETRETMKRDCRSAIARVLGKILFGVVEEFWLTFVIKPLRALMEPLSEMIPDPVKQFLDPEDLLERTLNNILLLCATNVVTPYASRIDL